MDDVYKLIAGHESLLEWFGYWPSFHDAEVLTLLLDRRHVIEEPGPRIETRMHVFEMTKDVDANGYFVLRKHAVVTFQFDGVEDLELDGFNHQNAIYGLEFYRGKPAPGGERIGVRFDPAFGVECSFACRSAVLLRLEPGAPQHGA